MKPEAWLRFGRRQFLLAGLLAAQWVHGRTPASGVLELESPDGRVQIALELKDFAGQPAAPVYRVSFRGQEIISESRLGLDGPSGPLAVGLELVTTRRSSADTTWKPVYGERRTVRDHYSQAELVYRQKQSPHTEMRLTLRSYDEGVAFCYSIPTQTGLTNLTLTRETTEFRFPADYLAWATYTAQGAYTNVPVSRIRPGCERPLVLKVNEKCYAAVAEARLVDYARMKLAPLAGVPHSLVSILDGPVTASLPLRTPWRVILLADSPARLLENNGLLLNLNDPCALADTSWIKPGKVLRETSLTTAGAKACVDFAATHNLQYILFDAGWYGPEASDASDARGVHLDPARSAGPLDLQDVLRYANAHEVGVLLYVNRRALERQLDELLPLYQRWGVKGIKFGFVSVGSQRWTSWLHEAVRKAAEHRLLVDVHDEYRPTGWSRTYPNLLTQEGVRGDEERQPNSQGLTTFFTRFIAGAADNTICYYDQRVDRQASHGFQLAKAVCFYSPLQSLYWYDHPLSRPNQDRESTTKNLLGDEPELEFFDHCPTVWDDTQVLQGAIGEFGIVARRSGPEWFVGCMNANRDRVFDLPLGFLDRDTKYKAWIYSDDPATPTRTHVRIETRTVDRDTVLKMTVTAQGGQAMRLVPAISMPAIRVMTYNIHHGEGLDGKIDLGRIADLIRDERADLVALQEVDKGTTRTGQRDLGSELAKLTGMSCIFSNNYGFQGGEYGNAVLTRLPVKRCANLHYQKVNESEQRGLLQVTLEAHGCEFCFLATHLDFRGTDAARWSNVGEIEGVVKDLGTTPSILCGDFNTTSDSRVYRRLAETFDDGWARVGEGDGFTIPAAKPNRRIDYIWVRKNSALVPLKAWVPSSEASDHRPLVVEIQLCKPPQKSP